MNIDLMEKELEAMLSGSSLTASERLQAMTSLLTIRSQKQPASLIDSAGSPLPKNTFTETTRSVGTHVAVKSESGQVVAGDTPVTDMPKTATGRAALRMGRRSQP